MYQAPLRTISAPHYAQAGASAIFSNISRSRKPSRLFETCYEIGTANRSSNPHAARRFGGHHVYCTGSHLWI